MTTAFFTGLWVVLLALYSARIAFTQYSELTTLCVADLASPALPNGYPCKDLKKVSIDDFSYSGLNKTGTAELPKGSSVFLHQATLKEVPALNTKGLSIVRVEHEPGAMFPLHINHVDEVVYVINGTLHAALAVGTYPETRVLVKVLNQGDMILFPKGVPHLHMNSGAVTSTAIVALAGANILPVFIAETTFGSKPGFEPRDLAKIFKVKEDTIHQIIPKFS